MNQIELSDTGEFETVSQRASYRPEPFSSLVEIDVAGASHPGAVRPRNEDHFYIGRFGRFLETLQTNLPADAVPARSDETGCGMIVADGLGGSAAGAEASKLAIISLLNLVLHTPDWILRLDDSLMTEEVMLRASERFLHIHQRLREQALEVPGLSGFATTLTVAFTTGDDLFVAHVGDSRAYLFGNGTLQQLTTDHTLVQTMVNQNLISRHEAATHQLRHVLVQALGDTGHELRAEVLRARLEDGNILLLCTDGLTEVVGDDDIRLVLGGDDDAKTMCQRLIDLAIGAGGPDNITVVVARYRLPPSNKSKTETP